MQPTTPKPTASRRGPRQEALIQWLPWVVAALCLIYFGTRLAPREVRTESGMNLTAFAELPVSFGGRFLPWDSVARNQLLVLSGRTSIEHDGEKLSALHWLMEVKGNPDAARSMEMFRIDEPGVKDVLGLGREARGETRFSLAEIQPHLDELSRQAQLARQVDRPQRSLFQSSIIDLEQQVAAYTSLYGHTAAHSVPPITPRNPGAVGEPASAGGPPAHDHRDDTPLPYAAAEKPSGEAAGNAYASPPPPPSAEKWKTIAEAMHNGPDAAGVDPRVAVAYDALFRAYRDKDAAVFNAAVADLQTRLHTAAPRKSRVASFETLFNQAAPFTVSMIFYVVAGLAAMVSWLVLPRALVRVGVAVLVVALVVHTLGLASRIYISGRPPVTNLYSSAVFIGWGAVILALLLEPLLKHGLGVLVAAVSGFSTLLIARALAADGDTMAVLQAVLDTNIWLATHVLSIALGYVATYIAGGLGVVYVVVGAFTPWLNRETRRPLAQMIYGVICFATLLSLVGTILGGIWADQSWGRFWGWDPKENG
ncbi:MAG: cytochrome c biogenesis protein, partial [Phycisphaeraceae bacterium]